MLVSRRATAMLLEAVDRVGLDAARLLADLGLERSALMNTDGRLAWSTTTRLLARLSEAVDHDPERLREVGRAMTLTTTYEPIRRIARSTVSVQRLYRLAIEWVGPANFPHLRLLTSFQRRDRLLAHATIPDAYAPSLPFFHISTGSLSHLPTLLGLAPATIVEAQVTPRSMDVSLQLPRSRSRLRMGLAALASFATRRAPSVVDVLEEERRHLVDGVEAVQRAHREQRALLERLPDMVVIHVQGKIVYANDAFTRTLGWNGPDEILGRPLLDLVDPRSHAAFDDEMVSRADARGSPQLARASLLRQNGTPVLVEIAPPQAVVFDGVDARLVVGRDIEERVRLQEQLATADRLASLGLLAAGVAHEVNNPLAYVLNNIEIARRQLTLLGPPAEASLQALTVALEGVDRIRFIVRELLLLSRSEGESVGPVDVREVVESTLSLARPTIARIGTLVTELEEDAPPARANVARVAQIVLNLVLNAIEAMQASGPAANVLTVRLKKTPDDQVLLEVQDTGPGIEKQDLDRIFEPFFTTKPAGLGTGLGLSITQRLVVELGGHIDVMSTPRRGSTFRVVLPAAAEPVKEDVSSKGDAAIPRAAPLTAAESQGA